MDEAAETLWIDNAHEMLQHFSGFGQWISFFSCESTFWRVLSIFIYIFMTLGAAQMFLFKRSSIFLCHRAQKLRRRSSRLYCQTFLFYHSPQISGPSWHNFLHFAKKEQPSDVPSHLPPRRCIHDGLRLYQTLLWWGCSVVFRWVFKFFRNIMSMLKNLFCRPG